MTEFTLRVPRYNKVDHLHGTMVEFGRHEICYIPPGNQVEATIKHTISSEATLEEMLAFFEMFLLGSGYFFEGSLGLIEMPEGGRSNAQLQ